MDARLEELARGFARETMQIEQRLIEAANKSDHEIDYILSQRRSEQREVLRKQGYNHSVLLEDGTAVQGVFLEEAIKGAEIASRYPRLKGRLVHVTVLPTVKPRPMPTVQHGASIARTDGLGSGWQVAGRQMGEFTKF